jgi:hypothetical protein
MEVFGIMASIPAALIATFLYRLFLIDFILSRDNIRKWFIFGSCVVLLGLLIEVILLSWLGAVRSRGLLGSGFSFAHFVIFVLGTPALANILVLRSRAAFLREAFVVVPLCTVLAFCLVLLQYRVSEELYGIDGQGGPYSRSSTADFPVALAPR